MRHAMRSRWESTPRWGLVVGLLGLALIASSGRGWAATKTTVEEINAQAGAWTFDVFEAGSASAASSSLVSLEGAVGVAHLYGQALVILSLRDAAGAPVSGVEVTFSVNADGAIAAAAGDGTRAVTSDDGGQAFVSVSKASTGEVTVTARWSAGAFAQELSTKVTFGAFGSSDARSVGGWTVTAPGATLRDLHTYRAADAPAGLPAGTILHHGLTSFVIEVASAGDSATVTVTAPAPLSPISRLWMLTPSCAGGVPGAWSWVDASAQAQGLGDGDAQYTMLLTDGGPGDADCEANGLIVDPQGPAENPADIPTLAEWAIILLALLMAGGALWHLRKRQALGRGLAMVFVLVTGGALVAGIATSPLGVAEHEPGEIVGGAPMRSPLQPDAGTATVRVVAEITAADSGAPASARLHYRLAGGVWADVAAEPAPDRCASCWGAELPLDGVSTGDRVAYYFSATTASAGTGYLFDAANDVCAGVACGDHGRCLLGSCSCDTGWGSAACDACAEGYHGATCAPCPDCGSHGGCDDGLGGDGLCDCDAGWTGSTCAACVTNFYGPTCAACPSCGSHGDCDDGLGGDGQCDCDAGWTGATCAACATNYYGPTCAACPSCGSHGDCDDGPSGDGQCDCDAGWTGPTCATCLTNYYGPTCAACPSCGSHGDCDDGLGGDGECDCDSGYHGAACQYSCSDGVENGVEPGRDCGPVCGTVCPADCSQPSSPSHGSYGSCNPADHGATCTLSCNSGYQKSGDAVCDDGAWVYPSAPACYQAMTDAGSTMLDPVTGLRWENDRPYDDTMRYWQAKDHCTSLGAGWRIPSVDEVRSLIRGCPSTQTGGACKVTVSCPNRDSGGCYSASACDGPCGYMDGPGASGCYWDAQLVQGCMWYWSSTPIPDRPGYAWAVNYAIGMLKEALPGTSGDMFGTRLHVRCVRSY